MDVIWEDIRSSWESFRGGATNILLSIRPCEYVISLYLYTYLRYYEHRRYSASPSSQLPSNTVHHHVPNASTQNPNQLPASSMTSSAGLFPTPQPSEQLLVDWLDHSGVHVCDGIEVYESGNGWGVRAIRDIGFDELRTSPFSSYLGIAVS